MWSKIIGALLGSLFLLLAGCSEKFVIRKNKLETDYEALIRYINENNKGFSTYSIKYTGQFESPDVNLRFRGLLRIVNGEKIWISVSPFGIEAARILFTPNKIKFLNRQNNTYFIGNYQYFSKKYQVDLTYEMIENILTNRFLLLPSQKKQDVDKTSEGFFKVDYNRDDSTMQTVLIHPGLKKLTYVVFEDLKRNAKLGITFSDYIDVKSHALPETIQINIEKMGKDVNVDLKYKKITVNKSFKVPFRIPNKYKQVWP